MAWNVPQTPTWRDPSPQAKVNPGLYQPMAQQNTYGSNPYQDPGFGAAAGNADRWGDKLLGQGSGMASQMSGWLKDPASLMSAWGINQSYNPLDPYNRAQMGAGMGELRGNTQNLLEQGVKGMANAGIAAGRGGFGVSSGVGPEASAQQAMMKQLAGQYGSDYTTIAKLLNEGAGVRAGAMGSALGAGASMTGSLLNAGGQQGNLALGNRNALQSGQENWMRGMADENRWNAQGYNQQVQQAQQREQQRVAQQQAQGQAQDTQMGNQWKFNDFTQRMNQPGGGNLGQGDKLMLDYLRTQMGQTQPWARTEQVQRRA